MQTVNEAAKPSSPVTCCALWIEGWRHAVMGCKADIEEIRKLGCYFDGYEQGRRHAQNALRLARNCEHNAAVRGGTPYPERAGSARPSKYQMCRNAGKYASTVHYHICDRCRDGLEDGCAYYEPNH